MRTGEVRPTASSIDPQLGRLLEEAAAAGAEQVIVVSASPEPPGPHELRPPRLDGLGRLGEHIASAEAAALRTPPPPPASLPGRLRDPPVAQPDSALTDGAYDEKSDRVQPLDELMERGYEDAYRQFIEPVLGASGERVGPQTQYSHRLGGGARITYRSNTER